jgi:hypothetical protein
MSHLSIIIPGKILSHTRALLHLIRSEGKIEVGVIDEIAGDGGSGLCVVLRVTWCVTV